MPDCLKKKEEEEEKHIFVRSKKGLCHSLSLDKLCFLSLGNSVPHLETGSFSTAPQRCESPRPET